VRILSRCLIVLVTAALTVSALAPAAPVRAEDDITITLSVPSLWENTLTPDLLAEFEAQYPGVSVYISYTDTGFFGFGGVSSTIDERLDATEEFVTSADVLYIDPSSLTPQDTQAGYFLDLLPLVMNDPGLDSADFIPAAWQSYQWDNGMWALPLSVDAILLTYDPVAFDEAGLAYPNERWTIDDFANAARALTQYNADGTVATPGFSTSSFGDNQDVFLRALAGAGFYDPATMPNMPDFSNPNLEYILQVWYEMIQDGVVQAQGGGRNEDVPLRIEGSTGYSMRGFNQSDTVRYASLLPGGSAGLNVQGFAVSAGTMYPDIAYALAKFLTSRGELATNAFSLSSARYSLMDTTTQSNNNNANNGAGGPGGNPGGGFGFGRRNVPEEIQPVVDQGLTVGISIAELRYASYLTAAVTEMSSNGGDALSALQTLEAQAFSDTQTAQARYGTVSLFVMPPPEEVPLAPGEIALTCAVNLGFGGRMRGSQLPNQDEWDQVIADFVASDPQVGAVNLEQAQTDDLAVLAETYDCIILPSNAVPDADLSALLNLDPLIDTDTTFDRNDVIGNTLAQLQQDNKTWALPLAIEPQMLEYTPELFARAGVPEPVNGWTADAFTDALRMLKPYDTDPASFAPNDPSGSYLLMLIAAYGGLPLDYRTDPPTVNFTDPATVDAIRQVLDLAKQGYISYSATTTVDEGDLVAAGDSPITTNSLNQFRGFGGPPPGGSGAQEDYTTVLTTYPQGTQYGVLAYEITTGYISATTQNPEAAYRFLSAVARSPQLFSGMPARQSLVYDPAVAAAQGEELAAVYQQLDTLMKSPNTIVFPTFANGGGAGGALRFIQSYWLNRAFDRYVLEDADLEYELSEAQTLTLAYQECAKGVVADTTSGDVQEQQRGLAQQILACVTSVDPTFSLGN
jgi:ABC-type glycerol-3-phosphate transport system substrate-binding protein